MERRVFLAICLSILVMYLYQVYFLPPPRPRETPPDAAAAATAPDAAPAASPGRAPDAGNTATVPAVAAPDALIASQREQRVIVSTKTLDVELTNRGGVIEHWRLKDYLGGEGKPVDLIPAGVPAGARRPFMLELEDPQTTSRVNTALYRMTGGEGRIDATGEPAVIGFEYQDAAGLHVRKEFRFEPDSYVVTFDAQVLDGQEAVNPVVHWGPGLGDSGAASGGGSFFTGNYVQPPGAIYHLDNDVERLTADAVRETPDVDGEFVFAGIDDHYFLASTVQPGRARIDYAPVTVGEADEQLRFLSFAVRFDGGPRQVRFYAGPKELEELRDVHPQLVYSINFGIFQWIVVPLLQSLKWLYGFLGNYGWSIIVLTVIINVLMFPFRHKSVVSMRKMQAIQPEVKAIQERYADLKTTDPARQKMNTEIMNLYRERGVNPAAGCVPMLLTMPVLLAFYSMLSQAIELRGAEFGFWIHDLSQRDPFYVTPLLMGATMFWQQWIMPTTVDPMQQRMMMIMPVVFTVMFLQFPSGLAIYYLASNVFQIGQQYITNRIIGPPPGARPRPAAERRLKKPSKAG